MRDRKCLTWVLLLHKLLPVTITNITSTSRCPAHFPAKSAGCHAYMELAHRRSPRAIPVPDIKVQLSADNKYTNLKSP